MFCLCHRIKPGTNPRSQSTYMLSAENCAGKRLCIKLCSCSMCSLDCTCRMTACRLLACEMRPRSQKRVLQYMQSCCKCELHTLQGSAHRWLVNFVRTTATHSAQQPHATTQSNDESDRSTASRSYNKQHTQAPCFYYQIVFSKVCRLHGMP